MPLELVRNIVGRATERSSPPDRVAEANHRIANNLTLIAGLVRMRASSMCERDRPLTGQEVRLVLEELGGRIDNVARLHRYLADAPQQTAVDLADYLRDLAQAVVSSLSFAAPTELRFAADPGCIASPQTAVTLGLIVDEVMTNAIKYAHPAGIPGKITVGCRSSFDTLIIEVSDDGVGFPEGFDPTNSGLLGLRLVRSLAKQLGAQIDFHDTGLGLSFVLKMPRASA